jgi:hypothetical protein
LKSKVASVLPAGSCASFRWRLMRRMSRPASAFSARTARKRAAGQPSVSVRLAISAQSLRKAGQPRARSTCRSHANVDLAGGHALAPRRASKLSSAG